MSEMKPCELVHIFENSRLVSEHFTAESVTATYVAALGALRAQPDSSRFADCHIWEPDDKLDTISDKCDVLIKAEDIRALIYQSTNKLLTCEGCVDFDALDDDRMQCGECRRLIRSTDCYRSKPEGGPR